MTTTNNKLDKKDMQIYMIVPRTIWHDFCKIAHAREMKPRLLVLAVMKKYLEVHHKSE